MTYQMYQAAKILIAKDIAVFPCAGKIPVTPDGFYNASTDPNQIREWFEFTDFNIAVVPGQNGWFVVDVDLGADKALVDALPPTLMVRTPSGGNHYYYDASELDAEYGNKKLANKIDIRHMSGYVLVPPSPGYVQITPNEDLQSVPTWVTDKLKSGPTAQQALETTPVTLGELLTTMGHIPPDCDYNAWARILAALAATNYVPLEGQPTKADIALAWSNGEGSGAEPVNACGYDFDMEAKLATFGPDGVGYGTLRYLAGYEPVSAIPSDLDRSYTAEEWIERDDIEEREQLIGPISKTSRVMLVALTGLGKTHVAMAIACSIASGKAWLPHWCVPEPAKVLYIDGEMPATLIKDRITEAARRVGVENLQGRLTFLNYADFLGLYEGGMPAMESTEGHLFIDQWLKRTGAQFVVFDNIQSLTIGDMKETDSWRKVQAFCRKLTDQGVGQLWVHHANKDGSMYGDKTRAYQFDTVMSLTAVDDEEKADGELAFELSYQKTRELHPEKSGNRYDVGRVSLTKSSGWQFQRKAEIEERAIASVISDGQTYTTAELCEELKMSKMTLSRYARGKWAKFVVWGSKPRLWRNPVPTF